jgi:PAS domain-containing protein
LEHFTKSLVSYLIAPFRKFKRGLRLRHAILACVLASILITELIVLGASYALWSRDQIGSLYRETLLMFKSNVDATSFMSVDATLKMGQRISSFSNVRGGIIYNSMGEQLASFGQAPALSMRSFQREGIRYLISADEASLDIFYPIELTGLANPVVLRLDVRDVPAVLHKRLEEKAMATLSVAFISALAIVLLLNMTVVTPILRLREAVLKATDNPNSADSARLNWARHDEFGDVAKALDMLFTTVSVVYQEDLAAGQEARQQSAFAILTYDSAWRLINANAAALALFGVTAQDEIAANNACFIRHKTENGTEDIAPASMPLGENTTSVINVVTRGGIKRCLMNAVGVHKRTGAVFRTVITLVDITRFARQIEGLKMEAADLGNNNIGQKRRLAEMRALFQSCLILLSNSRKILAAAQESNAGAGQDSVPETKQRPVTLTDRVVNAWYAEAHANHLIESKLTHDALPPAYGPVEEVEAVFTQGLMAVYAQAGFDKPAIHIKSEKITDNKTGFEIWAEAAKDVSKPRPQNDLLNIGAQLSVASLKQALKVLGGEMREAPTGRVSFFLDTAPLSEAGRLRAKLPHA